MGLWNYWADRLEGLGGSLTGVYRGDEASAFIAGFADERGNRLATDSLLLSHALGVTADPAVAGSRHPTHPRALDEALWHRLLEGATPMWEDLSASPPLLDRDRFGSIEVWTESLLCSLHALGWLQWRDPSGGLAGRLQEELAWIIEHVEPDNATRHPWGVHLFLDRAIEERDAEAMLYAEEQIHVCRVGLGRPGVRSAWILRDSACWLRGVEAQRRGGSIEGDA